MEMGLNEGGKFLSLKQIIFTTITLAIIDLNYYPQQVGIYLKFLSSNSVFKVNSSFQKGLPKSSIQQLTS